MNASQESGNFRVRIIQLGLAVALAGAGWAAVGHSGCSGCHDASERLGAGHLGLLGVIFYGGLISWLLLGRKPGRAVFGLVMGAAGVHLVLVIFLFRTGVLCPACLLTAAGAFLAVAGCFARKDFTFSREGWALPVMALAAAFLIYHSQSAQQREYARQGQALLSRVLGERAAIPFGRGRLIAYVRPNCSHCQSFKNKCLPILRSRFGESLTVELRTAPDDLPTPTIILLGNNPSFLVGNQPCKTFVHAIQRALASDPRSSIPAPPSSH